MSIVVLACNDEWLLSTTKFNSCSLPHPLIEYTPHPHPCTQSRYMSERKLEPKDVPGTFLNLALLNLGSTDSALRAAAYKLLSAAKDTFQLRIDRPLESSHDLCIPVNCADFVVSISCQLARNKPHFTLEFLSEVVAGFQRYSPALKQHCLAYISPWLPNLALFASRGEGPSEQEKVCRGHCCKLQM